MIRVVCSGLIKGCPECKDSYFQEGYCKNCKRPLWMKIGDKCNSIIGYYDGQLKKRGKCEQIHFRCTVCNSMTTVDLKPDDPGGIK